MYVIIDKNDNVILGVGNRLDYAKNGYPMLVETNTQYVAEHVLVREIEIVPDDVNTIKYCYSDEDGLYPNPLVQETETNPWNLPQQIIDEIKEEAIAEVQKGATNGKM